MNGKDIFLGLKYVGEDLIQKAEYGQLPAKDEKIQTTANKRNRLRRPFLIAAIIAMILLLVGCAVVYMLSMEQIKLGEQTATRDIYEYDPDSGEAVTYVRQETYTQQVLTLAGMGGTPASLAAQEWYAFLESYDPDREIQKSVWGNYPEFPEEYAGYGLYTQEMKEKLDEILEKYDLKLRGACIEFQTGKLLFRALGMENVLNTGSAARMRVNHASYYENGNLDLAFEITIPDTDGSAFRTTNGYLYYRSKDCLIPDTAVLTDAQWEEWNYTTRSGQDVLIVRSEESSAAWIFCDMPNHTASLRLDNIRRMYQERETDAPIAKFEMLTKEQLEQAAEAVNFSIEPELIDGWETLSDDAVPAGQKINGFSIEPVSTFTDGYAYQIVLRIIAPEGVLLTDPNDHTARTEPGDGVYGYCVEDGDGKLNTCHFILSESTRKHEYPEEGSRPYPEGSVIPVYWEDLYFCRYDMAKSEQITTLLTEGTWKFNIPLATADTREIELLTQPITAKGCVGWKMDGTDVLETLEITSITLRSLGIDLVCEGTEADADFLCFTGQFSCIAMKDGTWIEFASYAFDDPIDLEQVAYVQLADKTIIPMPGMEEETVLLLSEMIQAEREAEDTAAPAFGDGIELLTEPIIMKSLAGYVTDPTGYMEPLYEELRISSIILHTRGLAIMGPAAFDAPDNQATVVLKDGSNIMLTGMGGSPYGEEPMSRLEAESVIDLSLVDHVLLPDGTMLTVPNAQ